MNTFQVQKTFRDEKSHPIESIIIGIVTAYTFGQAMKKAADKFNAGNWANISVKKQIK